MAGRHLSVSQLRLLLGCARQWVESGRLPSHPTPGGGAPLVRRTDLDAFVAANGMSPLDS